MGLAFYLTISWSWWVGGGLGMKEGSESWTTVENARPPTASWTPVPPGWRPCPTRFLHLKRTDSSWPRVWGERACAQGGSKGATLGLPKEVNSWGTVWGAWRHCKLRITSSAVCRDGVCSPWAQGDTVGTTDRRGDRAGAGRSSAERALTDGPSGRCPRWLGQPGPCQGR